MLASGVFAGVFTADYAYSRTDRDGKTFGDELQRIGYRGPEKAGARKFAGMFELHIEQGPILEHEGRMIGIVQGAQGVRWYDVTIHRSGCACRRHADGLAQRRAGRRRANDRAHRGHRPGHS